jgi:hypothetical protein
MPKPIALCIEDLRHRAGQPRYVACVAVAGRQAGLGLDGRGEILWQEQAGLASELWVSGDEQLILYRPENAPALSVHRGGRSLAVPFAKPVVLRDQDELELEGRRLRLHVHGVTAEVNPPRPLPVELADDQAETESASSGRGLRGAAAALALGSLLAGACEKIEVRAQPPAVAPRPVPPAESKKSPAYPDAGVSPDAESAPAAPKNQGAKQPAKGKLPPAPPSPEIEVRQHPPHMAEPSHLPRKKDKK